MTAGIARWRHALALALLAAAPAAASESRLGEMVHELEPMIQRWGYPAVTGAAALDFVGIPVPADTVLVSATVASTRGDLRLGVVLGAAALGMIAGSQVGFRIGRHGGRTLLARLPLAAERVAAAERRYALWGGWLVLVSPFLDGLRQINGLVAGTLGMAWWRFTAINTLAALVWAAVWMGATILIDEHVAAVLPVLRAAKPWLVATAILGLMALIWRLRRRRAAA